MVAMQAPQMGSVEPQAPVKPETDTLDYRRIRLDNGLEVLLVHDEGTDKAAASVDVSYVSMDEYALCLGACLSQLRPSLVLTWHRAGKLTLRLSCML